MKKHKIKMLNNPYVSIAFATFLITPFSVVAIEHSAEVDTILNNENLVTLAADYSSPGYVTTFSDNYTYINGAELTSFYNGNCNSSKANYDCTTIDNYVVMDSGTVKNSFYGSYSSVSDFTSTATAKSTVYLYGGVINSKLYGANSYSPILATATSDIYIYGGSINNALYGAYAETTLTPKTTITSGGSVTIDPPNSSTATATGNVYLYDAATVNADLYGAYASPNASYADANITSVANSNVYIYGGTVTGNVYAAYIQGVIWSKSATNSTATTTATGSVYLYGGEIEGNVYAAASVIIPYDDGYSTKAIVQGNIEFNKGTLGGNLYGAYVENHTANSSITAHSTITIADQAKLQREDSNGNITYSSEIWGGYLVGTAAYYDVFTGNTLNMSSSPLIISKLGNFEYYNFAINDNNSTVINDTNSSLITVNDSLTNSNTISESGTTINQSHVKLTGISGTATVNAGDFINLITLQSDTTTLLQGTTTTNLGDFFITDNSNTIDVGLVRTANVKYEIRDNSVVAVIDSTKDKSTDDGSGGNGSEISPSRLNKNVKPLAEGRLAGLSNAVRGADSLINILSLNHVEKDTFTPIVTIDGGTTKYHSGSHIDARDYRLMVGSRYQIFDNLYAGLAFEYGRSNYDTYNSFSSGNIHGSGHTYNYGSSLFTKYSYFLDNDEFYLNVALRFGRTSTEFGSNDIITGGGVYAHYKSKVNYIGGIIGTGYVYSLNNKYAFDSSVHYFYTRLNSDRIVIDGDKVNFEKSTSSRVQLKEQFNYQHSNQLTFTLAGIYEYEFDGRAKANVSGIGVNAPSLKGSTGIFELGVKAKPIENNPNLDINLTFRGYTGKRDGINAFAMIKYDF